MSLIAFILTLLSIDAHAGDLCTHFTVISHRGFSARAPEESKLAYLLAADLHTDYLEMDIQRTKDQVLIANHDNTFARTTNIAKIYPTRVNDQISTFTWDEVSKLETGTWFNTQFPKVASPKILGSKILKLENVVNISLTHPNHPGLYIESKSPELYPGIEKQMVDLLEKTGAFKKVKVIFQSFDSGSLEKFKALRPEIPRVYLTEESWEKLKKHELDTAIKVGNGIGPDFKTVPYSELSSFLQKAHEAKQVVHFWTVDSSDTMNTLIQAKADGAFTNRTDLLLEACQRMNEAKIEEIISKRLSPVPSYL